GLAELAGAGAVDAAAGQVLRHQLHAVADAERRDAEVEDRGIDVWRALGVHRRRPAREDQRDRIAAADLLRARAVRDELRVDTGLAHAPRDQLRILPAEVDHEHRALFRERLRAEGDDVTGGDSWARLS